MELSIRREDLTRGLYLVQGVVVPAGTHTVDLSYDDPWTGYGLAASLMVVALLAGGAVVVRRRERVRDGTRGRGSR